MTERDFALEVVRRLRAAGHEALFSILGNAVPDRPFVDVFAGTGVVGLEALSRGASSVTFVERDFRLSAELERHAEAFGVRAATRIDRADVYRWAERWQPPAEPVTVFISPPFADFEQRAEDLLSLVAGLQQKMAAGSVLVLQAERSPFLDRLPDLDRWDQRRYGRNWLLIWGPSEGQGRDTVEDSADTGETTS